MKRMLPSTLRLVLNRCSSSSGVSGPSFASKATTQHKQMIQVVQTPQDKSQSGPSCSKVG